MSANIFSPRLAVTFARRELRAGLQGFYVFLACLVLGVGAIAAIQSVSRGLVDSLQYDGRYILGADIAVRTMYKPLNPRQLDVLKQKYGAVSTVTQTRGMARREDDTKAAMMEIKAVDNLYPLYGTLDFTTAAGQPLAATPAALLAQQDGFYGAAVEKDALTRLGVTLGDKILVGQQAFVLRAIITREPDRISSMGYNLAPRLLIAADALPATGLIVTGSQVYYDHRLALPQAKTLKALEAAEDDIQKLFPDEKLRIRNSFKAAPRAEEIIDRLGFFLTLIGLTTLLVGGVGISNAVRGYLDTKLSHIATLKCMGASGRFIIQVYLLVMLALATVGIALGLLIGAGAAQVAGEFLTAKFSLSDRFAVYPSIMAVAAAFGFLTTLSFSLWPLGRAARVKPSDLFRDTILPSRQRPGLSLEILAGISAVALAALAVLTASDKHLALWFVAASAAAFLVFAGATALMRVVLRRLRPPGMPEARMAIANLYRPGNVTGSIVMSLGLGLTVLVAVALVQFNFSRLIGDDLAADAPSFFFLDIQGDQKDAFTQLVNSTPSARELHLTPSLRGRVTLVNGKPAEQMLVDKSRDWVIRSDRGFTYMAAQPRNGSIIQGKWWPQDYKGPPLVSIADDVAKAFNIGVGDNITANILGVDTTATVANVREIDWASFTMNFAITFAPGALEDAPAGFLATVIVAPDDEEPLQAALAKNFPGITSIRVREALATAGTLVEAVAQAVKISAGVTLLAGALVLAGGVAAARRRHVYDAVILKVLGATRRRIFKTFLLEYGILGLVTVSIAGILGTAGAYAVIHFVMELNWKFSIIALLSVVVLCLFITLTAGFLGTWQALRQKPAPYLRNQ
ncbi:MAG: FtsX-like permease family protein [Micavibrio sp.]|nr:FtsX-like permease family protein [Micavibrio sp.]